MPVKPKDLRSQVQILSLAFHDGDSLYLKSFGALVVALEGFKEVMVLKYRQEVVISEDLQPETTEITHRSKFQS